VTALKIVDGVSHDPNRVADLRRRNNNNKKIAIKIHIVVFWVDVV
jgi:hypothetical protein